MLPYFESRLSITGFFLPLSYQLLFFFAYLVSLHPSRKSSGEFLSESHTTSTYCSRIHHHFQMLNVYELPDKKILEQSPIVSFVSRKQKRGLPTYIDTNKMLLMFFCLVASFCVVQHTIQNLVSFWSE